MNIDQKAFEKLATLKVAIKDLEIEAKELQKKLVDSYWDHIPIGETIQTKNGKFVLAERTTYDPIDNEEFIEHIGIKSFRTAATVSVSGMKKHFGEIGLNELNVHGLLSVKSVSKYLSLRK